MSADTFTPKWFSKQDAAMDYMTKQNHIVLAKRGKFEFGSFPDQEAFIEFINACDPVHRIFYEVLLADKPQRMFADLDGEGLTISNVEMYRQWQMLMRYVFPKLGMKFNSREVRVLNSTGEKISGHWSYLGKGYVFKNSQEQKAFWKYVESVIEQKYPDLCFTRVRADGKMELVTVLDTSVYSKNRPFRTIYSHKQGSDRVLLPCKIKDGKITAVSKYSPFDYLVYETDPCHFYEMKIPPYVEVKNKFYSMPEIQALITQHVPDVKIHAIKGRLITLRNTATRTCIIGGEENKTDNSFVVWRRDGLYFGCHDANCEGEYQKIHAFTNIEPPEPEQITWNDLNRMAAMCTSWDDRNHLIRTCVSWMNQRFCLVKANKTFVLEEFKDMDDNDEWVTGIKYKDLKSMSVDFQNKTLTTNLDKTEAKKHDANGAVPQRRVERGAGDINKINPYTMWINSPDRREVDKIIFDPKKYYEQLNGCEEYSQFYNLFDGFKITRESVDDVKVPPNFEDHAYFQHILKRWCNGNEKVYNVVLNMFAHIIQKPWEKMNISLVLRSTERTGKGLPLQIFKNIIGSKYFFQPSQPSHILGDFNAQLKTAIVCFLDEMVWGGDKEKAGTLKKLVTENTNYINEKYCPVLRIKSFINLFMASNEDWICPAGATEQRWLVENVSDELAIIPKRQKNKIVKDIMSIDLRMLAKFLYDRDLTGWSHRETVNTQGLRDQKIQSLSPIRKWWLDSIERGSLSADENAPFGKQYPKTAIYEYFTMSNYDRHMSERKFWIDMKHILGPEFNQERKMVGGTRKFYCTLPGIEACENRWRTLYNDADWNFN